MMRTMTGRLADLDNAAVFFLFVFTAVDAEYVERKNTEWKMRHKITGMEKFTKEN